MAAANELPNGRRMRYAGTMNQRSEGGSGSGMGANPSQDYGDDPAARRAEWRRYYSEKRIGHQWLQVHMLTDVGAETVLEIGPGLGLVTAMLDNAGFAVTTLDFLPSQYPRDHIKHLQCDLRDATREQLSGFDAIICCETLEHFHWDDVDGLLRRFRDAAPKHLLISVPYMGLQLDWRLYLNARAWRNAFSLKQFKFLSEFKFDEKTDPLCHKWEVGYRGTGLQALEDKLKRNGWRIARREFTSPTRSVFFLLTPS
jgi:hypothetical protein